MNKIIHALPFTLAHLLKIRDITLPVPQYLRRVSSHVNDAGLCSDLRPDIHDEVDAFACGLQAERHQGVHNRNL